MSIFQFCWREIWFVISIFSAAVAKLGSGCAIKTSNLEVGTSKLSEPFFFVKTTIILSRGWATELWHCRFKYVYLTSVNSAMTFFDIVTSHFAPSGPWFGSCVHHLSFAFLFGEWGIANWTRFWHQLGSTLLDLTNLAEFTFRFSHHDTDSLHRLLSIHKSFLNVSRAWGWFLWKENIQLGWASVVYFNLLLTANGHHRPMMVTTMSWMIEINLMFPGGTMFGPLLLHLSHPSITFILPLLWTRCGHQAANRRRRWCWSGLVNWWSMDQSWKR